MDAELKAKWVKALRSGKYEQGRGVMYSGFTNQYCCLGVLCSIKGMSNDEIANWSGNFDTLLPELDGRTGELWGMNDFDRSSFPQIADFIEREL